MLSGNLFQFDEYHQSQSEDYHQQQLYQDHQQQVSTNVDAAAVGDLHDYLTCDLKLSDNALNDLFSDFDINPNDFQSFDSLANHIGYSQLPSVDLPPAYDTVLLSNDPNTTTTTHIPTLQPRLDEYLSSNALKTLIEQHQAQQPMIKYPPSSPSPPITMHQTSYSETSSLLSIDIPEPLTSKTSATKKHSNSKRHRPTPTHLPKLIKKPEPIPVTLDQFQALIRSTPDTSTSNVSSFSNLLENSTIIGNNIPLKIVNQTNNFSSDENSRHDSPLSSHSTTNNGGIHMNGTGRVRRKSSHNAIEKRYRSSINERILELKEIVAENDEKVQKSGVLRRTVDYIRQLQLTNRRLEEENSTLKNVLKRLNLSNIDLGQCDDSPSSDRHSSVKNITTPPSSHSDSSDEAFSPVPKRQKRTTSKQGMVNGSRLVLCCFMLCVLITNPFSYLLNLIHSSDYNDLGESRTIVGSRTLQSTNNINNEIFNAPSFLSTSWRQLVAWMLNFAICLVCLVKLFVYGEPIISDSEMHEYYIYKKKADQLMIENLPNEARVYYRQCCEKLGVTIDQTLLYYLSSITWQMTRLCVNLIFLGRWLTFWSGWTKSIDTRDYNRELNDCLLQLWKIEYQTRSSSLALFNLFISTINTSMNGGKKIEINKRNEIYFLSAFTLNQFNGIFSIFISYLIKSLQLNDLNDIWLIDSDRLTEFLFYKQRIDFQQGKCLESIRQQFLEYTLEENIRNQLEGEDNCQQPILIKTAADLNYFSWWQHVLQLIRCISDEKQNIDSIHSTDSLRQINESNIYQLAQSIDSIDERYITIIETIHRILLLLNDDEEQTKSTHFCLLKQLGQASRLIISMVEHNENEDDQLEMATKTLVMDGILALRLRLLANTLIFNDETLPYLDDFQQELEYYRSWNQKMKLPKERLYLFESIFRLSSGLNPLTIQTSFESALKHHKQNNPTIDLLAALLLFCHYAPSTVYHYRTILHQIASISSKKTNDLSRLRQQCLTLIRQPYLTL